MVSQQGFASLTSSLLVRKGLAAPSLLGSEEQLYWESEQKILPGGLPSAQRKIVLPNLPLRQDHEAPPAANDTVVALRPTKSEGDAPNEELPVAAATGESRKVEKPVPVLTQRVVEEHNVDFWENEDEWLPVVTPAEARKPAGPQRKAKTRDDDSVRALPRAATAVAAQMPPDGKPHKMMITLTRAEFERLGIAAVKKGVTRHQIIRNALDLHMAELTQEYDGCGCMANGGSCSEDCGTD
jgi:hypothetical protein